ncbi:Pyrimidine pathway regulatory protein [Paramyrothecium foliicola]|nr:Pyrimidine pathway regulatory protein [Paramyrothecium foliicola]
METSSAVSIVGSPSQARGSPIRHRRGLKRSSAACRRSSPRNILPLTPVKCDGKHPSCETCLAAGVTCIPSERLVIRPDSDCECDQLRQQVLGLQAENERLRGQLQIPAGHLQPHSPITADTVPAPASSAQLLTPGSEGSTQHHATGEQGVYSGRILLPTFRGRHVDGNTNTSFLSSPWHLWQGLENSNEETAERAALPTSLRDEAGELVDLFFTRRWPQFPLLHKPTFLNSCFEPFINGQTCTGVSSFQVNIVLAIGASEKAKTNPTSPATHPHFFEAAIHHLCAVLAADDLECIQNLLLLCMYGSNEPQCVDLWYTVGLALRLALGIDLHRQETNTSGDFVQAEMRKRVFWSVYNMDRSISIAMGRPIGLQDTSITTALPLCLSDHQLLQPLESVLPSMLPKADDLSTFLHIIQLRRINAEIYSSMHSAGSHPAEAVDALDVTRYRYLARLNEWLAAAPRFVAPASMHQTSEWQQIAYHQAVLTLFRPSQASPVLTLDAMRLCADSAISMVSCYNSLCAKNKVTYTFVALVSLFMAAVTMLYTLRASPLLRQELTREIAESNVKSCEAVIRRIAGGRSVGQRSAQIIDRLGRATLVVFDSSNTTDNDLDTEFMSWFGLRCQHPQVEGQPTPSIDIAWTDLFDQGFDLSSIFYSDVLV